jgi:hypothetical protein
MTPRANPGIDRIARVARHAERRIRLARALRTGGVVLCVALAFSVGVVALRKVGILGERPGRVLFLAAGAAVAIAAISAWARRLPRAAGARALDRHHGLHDRLASALSFANRPPAERTPFMEAAIQDAVTASSGVNPRAAVLVRLPSSMAAAAGLTALLVGATFFEVPKHRAPVAHAKTIDAVEMSAEDLDDVHAFLRGLDQTAPTDETRAAIDEFNKLVDDIANRRLDRTEAFRRMEALEQKLLNGSQADKKALEGQLDRLAEELKKAELTRPAGEAIADHKLDRARDAMHELANRLANTRDKPVDKAKLDQLREALKKAAAEAERSRSAIEQRRQELADEILRRKQNAADGGSEEERSLLEKKQRELDRLDRDLEANNSAGRQLDRLDRELEQAAEDLMKDLGIASQDLERGAEDLNRMDEQEMTQQEKEGIRQKLQELRELMRQQGQGGKGQMVRLKRFGRMARGQGGSEGQGGQGSGQGQGEGQDEGQEGQGGPRPSGTGQGQGEQSGQQGQSGETWVLGPNGEKMLMLSKGQGGGNGGGADPSSGGAGSGRPWGDGHDPKLQGKATDPKMGTEDTQVQGSDTGQGGSRSQVILGAAERGFASRGYKRVFTEYHQVAEESLAKDEIPGGYRFYVKRYFQLIRPRDAQ